MRLGKHKDNGFKVAIKIVQKKFLDQSDSRWDIMKREIAILKLMDHPNILSLYDVLETKANLYLVLEYIKGGELFDYILSRNKLPIPEALRLLGQMIDGLEHCHQHSICHRDLKPENLLLDKDLNVKIADFGFAQVMSKAHGDVVLSTSCGSPHYAAPEIIQGKGYDGKKTDVWSLGVILFALVTGMLPFDHDHIPTLLDLVVCGEYSLPFFVPPPIANLIGRMLTVDPKKRISMSKIRKHACYKDYIASLSAADQEELQKSEKIKFRMGPDDAPWTGGVMDRGVVADMASLGWGLEADLASALSQGVKVGDSSDQERERSMYMLLVARKRKRLRDLQKLSPRATNRPRLRPSLAAVSATDLLPPPAVSASPKKASVRDHPPAIATFKGRCGPLPEHGKPAPGASGTARRESGSEPRPKRNSWMERLTPSSSRTGGRRVSGSERAGASPSASPTRGGYASPDPGTPDMEIQPSRSPSKFKSWFTTKLFHRKRSMTDFDADPDETEAELGDVALDGSLYFRESVHDLAAVIKDTLDKLLVAFSYRRPGLGRSCKFRLLCQDTGRAVPGSPQKYGSDSDAEAEAPRRRLSIRRVSSSGQSRQSRSRSVSRTGDGQANVVRVYLYLENVKIRPNLTLRQLRPVVVQGDEQVAQALQARVFEEILRSLTPVPVALTGREVTG